MIGRLSYHNKGSTEKLDYFELSSTVFEGFQGLIELFLSMFSTQLNPYSRFFPYNHGVKYW